MTAAAENDVEGPDVERRFGGIARLYGATALQRFQTARVCVVGVGGVGSWAVEALARSAIGHITLIDMDHLAESNINRQIHALDNTLGKAKVSALAERIALINPLCCVTQIDDFVTPDNVAAMLGSQPRSQSRSQPDYQHYDYVIDAIDNVAAKVAMIAYCRNHGLRLLTVGSAGGQTDPTKIEVRDLSKTEQEPLLAKVRKRLRSEHGFPRGDRNRFGVDAVFSIEPVQMPINAPTNTALDDSGVVDAVVAAPPGGLHCAGYGSAVVVTASFGLIAAAHVLRALARPDSNLP